MKPKKILGLDVGTNSIGWSFIEWNDEAFEGAIKGMGSRIIPTDAELLSNFETGLAASKNAGRRQARGIRRMQQRYKLRRQRLVDILKLMDWLPAQFTSGQQLPVNKSTLDEMKAFFGTDKIPADWVVYYLRHKALTQAITKEELARVLYHINQRRGFKSNRKANDQPIIMEEGEEEGRKKRVKTIEIVTVTQISDSGEKVKGNPVYNIHFKDGRVATTIRRTLPEWMGERELELTWVPPTKKDAERWECRIPDKTDWVRKKEALEKDIHQKMLPPGTYFLYQLKENREYRIKENIITRSMYEAEIKEILETQMKLQPAIFPNDEVKAAAAVRLYPHNLQKQQELRNNDWIHLLLNDIIYYQRPLKSQKHSIGFCRFESRKHVTEKGKKIGVRVAPASSPVFQEFRIWQNVNNIRILKREGRDVAGKFLLEQDVTGDYMHEEKAVALFELFDGREKVSQKQILKVLNLNEDQYLVNLYRMDEEKELPGNETKAVLRRALRKTDIPETEITNLIADGEKVMFLWHVLYSIDSEEGIISALTSGGINNPLVVTKVQAGQLAKTPAFKPQYAALSAKAMRKMLPLMRSGLYWKPDAIDAGTFGRIEKIITSEYDEGISDHTREQFIKMGANQISDFQGLQTPMAAYAVYGIHSEKEQFKLEQPSQLQLLSATELRNPVVTQIVNETLRLTQDVWAHFGRPDQIHIELGRDLKKNAKERAEASNRITNNRKDNERIAAILRELKLGGNPNSLGDIEKLKLWEQQADGDAREAFKEIKFKRPSEPTRDELEKYKLWCEQKHLSPYSGDMIPISKLFTTEYEVDHIIPRSRYFDDSFDNKVVVETALNKEKDNATAYKYILEGSKANHKLLRAADYEAHVKRYFFFKKRRLLLSEEVPEGFISRQLNDTRHISRKLNELLGQVATHETDPVIVTNGIITNELKNRWGLSEKMKEAVKWRFERLGEKTGKQLVHYELEQRDGKATGKKMLKLEGYEKRIDHRHHALDALVIACTTRSYIQYMNTLNAQEGDTDLKNRLSYLLDKPQRGRPGTYKFRLPWPGFVEDAEKALHGIVVSFKNNIRLTGMRKNRNLRFVQDEHGNWVKVLKEAETKSPSVRQSLHKATFAGRIHLPGYKTVKLSEAMEKISDIASPVYRKHLEEILASTGGDVKKAQKALKDKPLLDSGGQPVGKVDIRQPYPWFVNRVSLDASFDEKKIGKVPDKPLADDLRRHLDAFAGNAKEAFSQEGLEKLDVMRINAGKKPVRKVRIKEDSAAKFEISSGKWVEADKGTNLFFVIYEKLDEPGVREYASIPLRDVIDARLRGDGQFVEQKEGYRHFLLSPNDLVYLPDEGENLSAINWNENRNEIAKKTYKLVSVNKAQAFFVPQTLSQVIEDKVEFDSMNKVERGLDGRMIKQYCLKLTVGRLGNIKPV
jgi:CRISPR-associated endonuclease Csn1